MTKTGLSQLTDREILDLPHHEFLRVMGHSPTKGKKARQEGAAKVVDLSDSEAADVIRDGTGEAWERAREKLADLSGGGDDEADRIEAILLGQSGADLSETPVEELTDDQFLAEVGKIRSGEAGHEQAVRNTVRRQAEELAFWKEQHERGEVVPRNFEEHLVELGLVR